MDSRRFDQLARLLASAAPRRTLLRGLGLVLPAALLGHHPPGAAAGCKKVGKKCDKNQDCCDGARCQNDRCECKSGRDECGNDCVKLDKDEKNCGRCNRKCGGAEICRNGDCKGDGEDGNGPCGGETCADTEECVDGVCTAPPAGCPVGADSCVSGGFLPCSSGAPCVCLQSTEGTTHCGNLDTAGGICGQCETSADCASFGSDAFCATTCCPNGDKICRLPCPV